MPAWDIHGDYVSKKGRWGEPYKTEGKENSKMENMARLGVYFDFFNIHFLKLGYDSELFLSTEIFRKMQTIYRLWRETRVYSGGSTHCPRAQVSPA